MRSARQRRVQVARKTSRVQEVQQPVEPAPVGRKEKRPLKRMEEEKPVIAEPPREEEYDDSSDDMPIEDQHEELKEQVAATTTNKMRVTPEFNEAIRERYQELIKELWQSQTALEEFGFDEEEKKILNKRVKLWLEYFISTATFREENVNLFKYMDYFCETQKFI